MAPQSVLIFSFLCFFCYTSIGASRIKIVDNGYEDILISLPASASRTDRPKLISSLKAILEQSSELLYEGTKGRGFFRSVVFLIPAEWGGANSWRPNGENVTSFEDAPPVFSREGADVTVTLGADQPYVLHHRGCGYRAQKISLSTSFLLDGTAEKSKVFVNLWSEFRYGIFVEKGFDDDKKFPVSYQIPGDPVNRTTDCNLDFFRETGNEGNTHFSNSPHGPTFTPREGLFCEGYLTLGRNHNPEAPSKHNLLCGELGTWFVVRRSPDYDLGRNAARLDTNRQLNFRFVREVSTPKVLVAIEISARMGHEERYKMVQNAFSHFVLTLLPDRSELSLVVFGGGATGVSVITAAETLRDEEAKIAYLEGLPLPDETTDVEDVCLDCVLGNIFKTLSDSSSTAEIILVTAQSTITTSRQDDLRRSIEQSENRLHVFSFMDDHPDASYPTTSIYDFCLETEVDFVSLKSDPFGDLYRAFGNAVTSTKVMILHKYLPLQDDEDMDVTFTVDSGLSSDLIVTLTGPTFKSPLDYASTTLTTPARSNKLPKKQELVPSWIFEEQNPEVGEYTLRTRRKFGETKPILLSVTSSTSDDFIRAKVWVEILVSEAIPSPIQIFTEVKQGHYPVRNARVVAHIHHPGSDGVSEVTLVDDGQANIDITEGDGIYSYIYTNFTSTGFHNVYVEVTGNENTEVLKGPFSACCGSSFPYRNSSSTGPFQREVGPATFHVKSLPNGDHYPPSQVTDLHIFKTYDNDNIVVLRWTAVGDNYNTGVATRYDVKLFLDRFLLRHHFDHSPELSVFSDSVATTGEAVAGTGLFHQARLTSPLLEKGVHYFAVRAVDAAGNAGPPSNAVPLWLERPPRVVNCDDEEDFTE